MGDQLDELLASLAARCRVLLLCSHFNGFFYRAMHFSAKRGIAIACPLSVRL